MSITSIPATDSQSLSPNNLLYYRQRFGISQTALAKSCDCGRRTIGYIEAGQHDPSVQLAYRICNALGEPLDQVFPDLSKAN